MKKLRFLVLLMGLLTLLSLASLASAGYADINANFFGGGSVTFYSSHSTSAGSIYQEYTSSGDIGSVNYQAGYINGVLNVQIDAEDSGSLITILDPAPSHSWTANANYLRDGTFPESDTGSDTTQKTFSHSWTESFLGGGVYSIN